MTTWHALLTYWLAPSNEAWSSPQAAKKRKCCLKKRDVNFGRFRDPPTCQVIFSFWLLLFFSAGRLNSQPSTPTNVCTCGVLAGGRQWQSELSSTVTTSDARSCQGRTAKNSREQLEHKIAEMSNLEMRLAQEICCPVTLQIIVILPWASWRRADNQTKRPAEKGFGCLRRDVWRIWVDSRFLFLSSWGDYLSLCQLPELGLMLSVLVCSVCSCSFYAQVIPTPTLLQASTW